MFTLHDYIRFSPTFMFIYKSKLFGKKTSGVWPHWDRRRLCSGLWSSSTFLNYAKSRGSKSI